MPAGLAGSLPNQWALNTRGVAVGMHALMFMFGFSQYVGDPCHWSIQKCMALELGMMVRILRYISQWGRPCWQNSSRIVTE